MHLALWNYPPAEFIASGFDAGKKAPAAQIERAAPWACEPLLRGGQVEVALLPTLSVLRNVEAFDVIPAVALSSWSYPFAKLVLKRGLEKPVERLACDPRFAQEIVLSQIVLKEHYGAQPAFVPLEAPTCEELLQADADACLIVGPGVPTLRTDFLQLDLGQEWFELASYPMVWGLFVTRRDEATAATVRAMRRAAKMAGRKRKLWIQAQETVAELHGFYQDDLRIRLDDLATASLTEFTQYLFLMNMLDEVPHLPFFFLDAEEEDEDETPLL